MAMIYNLDRALHLVHQPFFWRVAVAVLIFLIFYWFKAFFTRYLSSFIIKVTARNELVSQIVTAFERPLRDFFILLGLYIALAVVNVKPLWVSKLFRSAGVILIAWGLYNLCEILLSDQFKDKFNIDLIFLPFFSKMIRFIIIALAVCVLAQEWDYDINGFVAGLGLGGLAFALAAKDTLANIFGGLVIVMDKPFTLEDWISTPSVEGTVENISFRSTRVRTATQALVSIPNSTLAGEPVTNWSRMGKRRVNFVLPISYHTTREQLQHCLLSIKSMLVKNPGVMDDDVRVVFEKIAANSLEVKVDFYTSAELNEYLGTKEAVNFAIMDILETEGVALASSAGILISDLKKSS